MSLPTIDQRAIVQELIHPIDDLKPQNMKKAKRNNQWN